MDEFRIDVGPRIGPVSGLLLRPPRARALLVLAHGAGAGMRHISLERVAAALADAGIATLRYAFPYAQAGRRRPDPPAVLAATVRAAVAAGAASAPALCLFAGGKSMGGRMTAYAAADGTLEGVRGLVFLGFPLHPPRRPGTERAARLAGVRVPMLFVQGTRDELADLGLLQSVVAAFGPRATLHVVDGADHGFAVLRRSGRRQDDVDAEIAAATRAWLDGVCGGGSGGAEGRGARNRAG
jgi:predicted alpha/beta-hydrolase family hydrolase